MRRVIQFSTGNVGRHALRTIIERPDLELVGAHANSAQKVGRDAAELCGLTTPSGVLATDDINALVALHADCVVYTSQAETRPDDAIDEISRFLAAGTNVVGTSMVWLVAPDHADGWLRDPLERACKAGDTSWPPSDSLSRVCVPACPSSPWNTSTGSSTPRAPTGRIRRTDAPASTAPSGLLATRDLPAAHIRGVMW